MPRFPNSSLSAKSRIKSVSIEDDNPAIQVFGRRFHRDQTPVEYLAEFLLVFAAPKDDNEGNAYAFPLYGSAPSKLSYHPRCRLALKLFSFLGASKLETRHQSHINSFKVGIEELEQRINSGSKISGNDAVRLIQGVFSGFVGVAGDRTWTAHTFLPASETLLARETLWKHGGTKGAAKTPGLTWDEAVDGHYFDTSAHSFMARGGELLYLQLASLFNTQEGLGGLHTLFSFGEGAACYTHLRSIADLETLRGRLQSGLQQVLRESEQAIGPLGEFVDQTFAAAGITSEGKRLPAALGWVPIETATEASLFGWEIDNICSAQRSGLQKISLLKDLCVLHVMRTLCFQSARVTGSSGTKPFVGNYAWIVSPSGDQAGDNTKKIAVNAYAEIENLLYESLRAFDDYDTGVEGEVAATREGWLNRGDDNVLRLFRKIGKQVGVIVPRNGSGMRITLPPPMVRLLVAALVPPGTRIQLDKFYERAYAHFGLAINQDLIQLALASSRTQHASDAFGIDSSWFEEELRRGGYLIPLSDAVALVLNPYEAKK
ncbi:hypothetical protein [Pigmentiphaga litoralis]|uniref:Uncharacterized protein n=1 Tax=Pigmentiphaga litoralis TaxID=516702 RepID=A0A7Y9IPP9_9BURK|nr:hypothetical protein [Pigmentiphaga litoralis]NYE25608.1 hypothetical protein [Pigmentiphaga litoralis]NYE80780.1 hypothetical protein [Pigmentiphaga litoralis]